MKVCRILSICLSSHFWWFKAIKFLASGTYLIYFVRKHIFFLFVCCANAMFFFLLSFVWSIESFYVLCAQYSVFIQVRIYSKYFDSFQVPLMLFATFHCHNDGIWIDELFDQIAELNFYSNTDFEDRFTRRFFVEEVDLKLVYVALLWTDTQRYVR